MKTIQPSDSNDQRNIVDPVEKLIQDAMNLATYAVENGRLPEDVRLSRLYQIWLSKVERKQFLSEEEVNYVENCYRVLESELAPVTAISLSATAIQGVHNTSDYMNTEAGKHAFRMWITAFSVLSVILLINLFSHTFDSYSAEWATSSPEWFSQITILYWFAMNITPFAYGAFGSTVRLLRVTEIRLRSRSFDPRRLPEHRNRLVLGTLCGGIVVMFYSSGGVGQTDVKLTEAALGFLAGYSIDVLFSILDRLVNAISPGDKEAAKPVRKIITIKQRKPVESFAAKELVKATELLKNLDTINYPKPGKVKPLVGDELPNAGAAVSK